MLIDNCRPQKVVWHGSHKLGDRAMDTYCDAWHSGSSDRNGLGSPLTGGRLLEQIRYSCDNKFALLCIEVTSEKNLKRKRRSIDNDDDDIDANIDELEQDEDDDDDDILLNEAEYSEYLSQHISE